MSQLYTLAFLADDVPVVFYVGHTNDPDRRRREHTNNPFNKNHAEYDTYKYRWCRSLTDSGIEYTMTVSHEIIQDEDTEYAWILKFARNNLQQGISFYDDYPLTNMKAGDFLTELLKDPSIQTASDIKNYRSQRAISYHRDDSGTAEPTVQGLKHIQEAHKIAEELALREQQFQAKKITRTTNPINEESVRKQNSLLLKRELEEGSMSWAEYNAEMQRIGYPEWTETRPQLLKNH